MQYLCNKNHNRIANLSKYGTDGVISKEENLELQRLIRMEKAAKADWFQSLRKDPGRC